MTSLVHFTKEDYHEADISFASEAVEVVQQKHAKMVRIGGKASFVVGLLIWKHTRVSAGQASNKKLSTTPTLPLESLVAAATGGIPLPVGEAELTVQDANATSNALKVDLKEEKIIGLEYGLNRRELLGLGSSRDVSASAVRYDGGKLTATQLKGNKASARKMMTKKKIFYMASC